MLSEDDCLLREILFNPRTKSHVERIREELKNLIHIIDERDEEGLNRYLHVSGKTSNKSNRDCDKNQPYASTTIGKATYGWFIF